MSKCSAHLFLLTSTDNYNQDSLLLMVHLDILSTERTSTAYSVVGIDVQESAFSSELSVNAIGSINIFHPDITIFIMDKDELLSRNGDFAGSRIVDSIDGFTTVPKVRDLDIGRTSIDKFDSYFVSISCRIIICAIIDSSVSAVQIIDRSGRSGYRRYLAHFGSADSIGIATDVVSRCFCQVTDGCRERGCYFFTLIGAVGCKIG